jgi:AcrR family transcriptional regulator
MARPLSQEARVKMLDASVEVALDVGVHRFTVDEVSRRSGLARTTIYRHFPTKEELLVAALDRLTPVPNTPDTGSLRGDLREFLAGLLPIFADRRIRALFLEILAAAHREPKLHELQRSMMDVRAGPTRAIFDRARARGEIAPHFSYHDAFLIFEAPLVMRALAPDDDLGDFDVEVHVDQMLLVLEEAG